MPLHILFLNDKLKKNTLKVLGAWKSAYTRKRLVPSGQLQWLAQVVRVNSRPLCRVHLFRFMGGETKHSILDVLKAAVVHALTRTWLRTWTWTCPISSKLWVLIKTWLRNWPEPAVYPQPANTGFLTAADYVDDLHCMPCLGERLKLCKCGSAILLYFLLRLSKTQVVLITYMLWFATINLLMTQKDSCCPYTHVAARPSEDCG